MQHGLALKNMDQQSEDESPLPRLDDGVACCFLEVLVGPTHASWAQHLCLLTNEERAAKAE
jgi:hypothetical protein